MSLGSKANNSGDSEGSSLWLRRPEVFRYEDVSTLSEAQPIAEENLVDPVEVSFGEC